MDQAPILDLRGLSASRGPGTVHRLQRDGAGSLQTRYRFVSSSDPVQWSYAKLINLCGTGAAFSAEGAWHLVESFGVDGPPEVELELLLDAIGERTRITASIVWVRPGDNDSSDWVGVRFDDLPAQAAAALHLH